MAGWSLRNTQKYAENALCFLEPKEYARNMQKRGWSLKKAKEIENTFGLAEAQKLRNKYATNTLFLLGKNHAKIMYAWLELKEMHKQCTKDTLCRAGT